MWLAANTLASAVCSAFRTCTLAAGLLPSLPSKNDQDFAHLVCMWRAAMKNVHAMPPAPSLETTACDLSTELLELQPAATYIIRGSNYQECFHGRLACHQRKPITTNYLHKNHRSQHHAREHTLGIVSKLAGVAMSHCPFAIMPRIEKNNEKVFDTGN